MGEKQPLYDVIGESYCSWVDQSPHNAYYERPAFLNLIGDVEGLTILDAGCGNGFYTEKILEKGAIKVVSFDNSQFMIDQFNIRLNGKNKGIVASLDGSLDFAEDHAFDLVICPLVLHYIKDWLPVFQALNKKLKPGGRLVFSVSHPAADYQEKEHCKYHTIEPLTEYWPSLDMNITTFRRSFRTILNTLEETGFKMIDLVEPYPLDTLKEVSPKDYEKLTNEPVFVCINAIKMSALH